MEVMYYILVAVVIVALAIGWLDSVDHQVKNQAPHEKAARRHTLFFRLFTTGIMFVGIVGTLIGGGGLVALTNSWVFFSYAAGITLGILMFYILTKAVIWIMEHALISVNLQKDLLDATNRNSALLEALLINYEQVNLSEKVSESSGFKVEQVRSNSISDSEFFQIAVDEALDESEHIE